MALSKITAASITDNTITNTQINSSAAIAKTKLAALAISNSDIDNSAAIAQSKLATLAHSNLPIGSVLQVEHMILNNSTSYGATSSSGHDVLNHTVTTKRLNSKFLVQWYFCHGVSAEENNMDSHDIHLFGLRTASSTHAYVGGNGSLTRQIAGSPGTTTGRVYGTDVPFSPSRGLTPAYGNAHDVFHRSGSFIDAPTLAAGVTNQYRIRMYNQSTVYVNRARGSASGSGGVSSIMIMEFAT